MASKTICVALVLLASHASADRLLAGRQLQQQAPVTGQQAPQRKSPAVVTPQQPGSAVVTPQQPGSAVVTPQQPGPAALVTPQQPSVLVPQQPVSTVVAPQQPSVILVPAAAATCTTIKDAQMPRGSLCISQAMTSTTTEVVCDSYDKDCIKTSTKTAVVTPTGDAYSNPQGFQASADAACKVLGHTAAGSGSIHMSGNNAKKTCWNGQKWVTDNFWVSLVCCK